jgi:hypothetical protein
MDADYDCRTIKSTRSGGILTGMTTLAFVPSTGQLQRTPSLQVHSTTVVHIEGLDTTIVGMCPKCLDRPTIILWEVGVLFHTLVEVYIFLNDVYHLECALIHVNCAKMWPCNLQGLFVRREVLPCLQGIDCHMEAS